MHKTKKELIEKNGCKCMLCGKERPYKELQWHHIKWRSKCREEGVPVDNSYENGAILCVMCHSYVHTLDYDSKKYKRLMKKVESNREPRNMP